MQGGSDFMVNLCFLLFFCQINVGVANLDDAASADKWLQTLIAAS
jgi:hypothetical protein